jgi:hypothetical protein
MDKTRNTRIDDLSTFGEELTDEHLALAAGGARKLTSKVTYRDGSSDAEVDFEWTF